MESSFIMLYVDLDIDVWLDCCRRVYALAVTSNDSRIMATAEARQLLTAHNVDTESSHRLGHTAPNTTDTQPEQRRAPRAHAKP